MKLKIFQSNEGDCLLLTGTSGGRDHHVLVDGGMSPAYRDHVAGELSKLHELEVVYVSHVDADHISGVLQMMDDAFDWRIFDHRQQKGVDHPKPKFPRPPKMKRVWHNAFHAQVPHNRGVIEDLVITNAVLASGRADLNDQAMEFENLATSIPQAIELSHRIGSKQLGLKHNELRGELLLAGTGAKPLTVGPMKFTIIGPFEDELDALRKDWNKFLKAEKNQERLKKIRAQARADARAISASSPEDVLEHLEARGKTLGDRKDVTVPNLASLMFLVEEQKTGSTILLTGDGHSSTILRGLERARQMKKGGKLHVDVLKVQHHGAAANIDEEFCRRITADHYVFCGNGAHDNPEEAVVKAILDSRPRGPFKLWFNSHHTVTAPRLAPHMRKIEKLVRKRADASNGRISFAFLSESSFELDV